MAVLYDVAWLITIPALPTMQASKDGTHRVRGLGNGSWIVVNLNPVHVIGARQAEVHAHVVLRQIAAAAAPSPSRPLTGNWKLAAGNCSRMFSHGPTWLFALRH